MSRPSFKIKAVIIDIEGTTTDKNFVSRQLFPMLKSNYDKFLDQTYDTPETKEWMKRLRQLQKSGKYQGMPAIMVGSKQQVIKSIVENIKWQMNKKISNSELKQLELLGWLWAYENDLVKSHVYDDVSYSLHNWKTKAGIKIYSFSSGMSIAQKLLFSKTTHGNIYPLIDEFFDNSIGSKTSVDSYKTISKTIGLECNQILFITDSPKEAKTAIDAGLKSVIIKRPGNMATDEYPDIPRINSFADLKIN